MYSSRAGWCCARVCIGTMAASGAATGAALEVIGRGEDHVRALEVVVLGLKRGRSGWAGGFWSMSLFSLEAVRACQKRPREQ